MDNQPKRPLEKTICDLTNIRDKWIHRLDEIPGFCAGIFSCLKDYIETALIDEMINMYIGKIKSNRETCERINRRNMTYHRSPNELERDRRAIDKCKSDNVIFKNILTEMYELYSGKKIEIEKGESYSSYIERVILEHKDYLDFCIKREDKKGMKSLESVYVNLHSNYTNSQKESNIFSRVVYMMAKNNEECLGYLVQMPSFDDAETIKLYADSNVAYNGILPKDIFEETVDVIKIYQQSIPEEISLPYDKDKNGQYNFFELIGVDNSKHIVRKNNKKSKNAIQYEENDSENHVVDPFEIIDEEDYEFPCEEIDDNEEEA